MIDVKEALTGAGADVRGAGRAAASGATVGLGRRLRANLLVWLLALVVVLALVIRVIDLTGVPNGFFCDEASDGIDAYLLGHTLRDQHGAFLPVFFQAFGDWRAGFHIYMEIPFVLLFGLTEFAVRLGSAVEGTLTVLLTYLFVARAYNRPVAVLSAFLLAIAPWHIMVSREGWEVVSLPFVLALCLALLYYSLDHPRLLPLGLFIGTLGIYTYQAGRLFFPLILLAWSAIYARHLWAHWRLTLIGVAASLAALIPALLAMRDGVFFTRLNEVSAPAGSLGAQIGAIWGNYLAHFSPAFLLAYTPDIILRHGVQGYGMLYSAEAPFLLMGAIALLARPRRAALFVLAWVILYPISAAIVDKPRSTRSVDGVIVAQVLIAIGCYVAWRALVRALDRLRAPRPSSTMLARGAGAIVALSGVALCAGFMRTYLVDYPRYSSGPWGWQAGPRQIVATFVAQRARYDRFLWHPGLMNFPDELLRFYTFDDPAACKNCDFIDITDATAVSAAYRAHDRILWAVTPDALATSRLRRLPHRVIGQVDYPDGSAAFIYVATGPAARRVVTGSSS